MLIFPAGHFEASLQLLRGLSAIPSLEILSQNTQALKDTKKWSVTDVTARPIGAAVICIFFRRASFAPSVSQVLFDLLPSSVVFRYVGDSRSREYSSALNTWLGQILVREVHGAPFDVIQLDGLAAVRFAPLESFPPSANLVSSEKVEEIIRVVKDQMVSCRNGAGLFGVLHHRFLCVCSVSCKRPARLGPRIDSGVGPQTESGCCFQGILEATLSRREAFEVLVAENKSLVPVSLAGWAGLGAVRFVPEGWEERKRVEVDVLNLEIISHLRTSDAAFSKGVCGADFLQTKC